MPTNLRPDEVDALVEKVKELIPSGIIDELKEIIKANDGDINATDSTGFSILTYVAKHDKSGEGLKLFLSQKGVDLNKKEKNATLLHRACSELNINSIKILVDKGATYQSDDLGNTPLLSAIEQAMTSGEAGIEIVEYLCLLNKPEENIYNKRNALHYAILKYNKDKDESSKEILNALLKSKYLHANRETRDIYGNSPLDYAVLTGNIEAIKILLGPEKSKEECDRLCKLPYFGKLIEVQQVVLNSKMIEYIDRNRSEQYLWNGKDIVDEQGQCNGWSFVWGHYVSLGKEDIFIAIKQAIATVEFGGGANILQMTLPPAIQRKYRYYNQQGLLDQYRENQGWFKDLRAMISVENIKKNPDKYKKEYVAEAFAFLEDFDSLLKEARSQEENAELRKELDNLEKRKNEQEQSLEPEAIFEIEKIHHEIFILKEKMAFGKENVSNKLYKRLNAEYDIYKKLSAEDKIKHPFKEMLEDIFEKYNDRKDVFEEIIPIVALFQATQDVINKTVVPNITQVSRSMHAKIGLSQQVSSFDNIPIFEDKIGYNRYKLEANTFEELKAELTKSLHFYSQFPGIYVDIGGGEHAVGFSVAQENGKIIYKYYDPNWHLERHILHPNKGVNTFDSIEELVEHIIVYKYKQLGQSTSCYVFPLKFENSQISFHPSEQVQASLTPEQATMQHAIIENEQSKKILIEMIKKNPEKFLEKDKNIYKSLDIIFNFKNNETSYECLSIQDSSEKTLLMLAIEKGINTPHIFKTLEKKEININQVEKFQENILMVALKGRADKDIIFKILDRPDLDLNHVNADKQNVLMIALKNKLNAEIVTRLLRKKEINMAATDKNNMNALMIALEQGFNKNIIMEILAREDLNLTQIDSSGRNALMIALEKGADKEIIEHIHALMVALKIEGSEKIIQKSIEKEGAKFDQVGKDGGENALLLALKNRASEGLILKLIEIEDAQFDNVDKDGRNALMLALDIGESDNIILKLIEKEGIKFDQIDIYGRNALRIALESRASEEVILKLIDKKGIAFDQVDKNGRNILMFTLENRVSDKIRLKLVEKEGIQFDQVDNGGRNVLIIALESGMSDNVILKLIEKGIQFDQTDIYGRNALMVALENRVSEEIILKIIEKEQNQFDQIDDKGRNALMLALKSGASEEIILKLIDKKGTKFDQIDRDGSNALMIALKARASDNIILGLIKKTANKINHIDKSGQDALMIALEMGPNFSYIQALYDVGAKFNESHLKLMHQCAQEGESAEEFKKLYEMLISQKEIETRAKEEGSHSPIVFGFEKLKKSPELKKPLVESWYKIKNLVKQALSKEKIEPSSKEVLDKMNIIFSAKDDLSEEEILENFQKLESLVLSKQQFSSELSQEIINQINEIKEKFEEVSQQQPIKLTPEGKGHGK